MKRRHLLLVALSLIISICMCFALSACSSCDDDETPTQLTTPVVVIDDKGVASWEAVENASGYAYKIDDGTEVETTELSRQLSDGQSISVKAVGDGANYSDSGWSEAQKYTASTVTPQPVKLGKPVVTIADDGTASWAAIANATKYTVKIGTTETDQTATSVKLENGQSIQVKAVGNGTTYLTGDWSDVKTYTVSGGDEHHHHYTYTPNSDGTTHNGHCDVEGCDEPDITNEAHVYDDDNDTTCNKCDYVREIGSGDDLPALSKPANLAVEINGTQAGKVDVTWDAVEHASGYKYQIGDNEPVAVNENSATVSLADGQSIKVMAVGDKVTYSDGAYCDEVTLNIDNTKTYSVEEIIPLAVYFGTTASEKDFTVRGVVSANAAYSAQHNNIDITIKQGDAAFVLFRAQFDEGVGSTETGIDELKNYTVTAVGKVINYNNNTPELNAGCKVTAIEMSNADRVANAKAELELEEEYYADFDLPAAGYGVAITQWESSDAAIAIAKDGDVFKATVMRAAEDKEVTLTAHLSYGEGDGAVTDTKAITVTVKSENVKPPVLPEVATLSFATTDARTSYSVNSQVWEANGIKLTNEKSSSTTDVRDAAPIRCYAKSSIKIEHANMISIVFNCNRADNDKYIDLKDSLSDDDSYTVTVEGNKTTVTFAQPVNVFEIASLTKQVRFDSIEVYFPKVAKPLAAPEITLDDNGNVTIGEVTGADGYMYKIGDGEAKPVENGKAINLKNDETITVWAVGDGENYVTAGAEANATCTTFSLPVPEVSLDEETGVASWSISEYGDKAKYTYIITKNGTPEAEVPTTETSVELQDGWSIKVKAVGIGTRYIESAYCDPVEYNKIQLKPAPELSTTTTGVSWTTVPNASGYAYKLNNGEWTKHTSDTLSLNLRNVDGAAAGIKVVVKALGTGKFKDSEPSNEITYTKQSGPIAVPTVEFTRRGDIIFKHIAAATFTYTINDVTKTVNNGSDSFVLIPGDPSALQTTVKVKANPSESDKADGLESSSEVTVTYTAPESLTAPEPAITLAIESGKNVVNLSWDKDVNAKSYLVSYRIGDGELKSTPVGQPKEGDKVTCQIPYGAYTNVQIQSFGDGGKGSEVDSSVKDASGNYNYSTKHNDSSERFIINAFNDAVTKFNEDNVAKINEEITTLNSLGISRTVTEEPISTIEIYTAGKTHEDVAIDWEVTEGTDIVEINENVLTIHPVNGTAKIKVTLSCGLSTDDKLVYTITVAIAIAPTEDIVFEFPTIFSAETSNKTLSDAITKEDIKVQFGGSGNATIYHSVDKHVRIYTNNTLTISSETLNIRKISFAYVGNSYNAAFSLTDNEPGTIADKIWTGKTKSVTLKATEQIRITKITITYEINIPDSAQGVVDKTKTDLKQPEPVVADTTYTYNLPLTNNLGATISWTYNNSTVENGVLIVNRPYNTATKITVTANISCTKNGDTKTGSAEFKNIEIEALPALDVPVVGIDSEGKASWAPVVGATEYQVIIDGDTANPHKVSIADPEPEKYTYETALTNGQKIQVKAIGSATTKSDSISEEATYTGTAVEPPKPELTTLATADFATDKDHYNSISSYEKEWTASFNDNDSWKINGFNNNNKGFSAIKGGRKGVTSTGYIKVTIPGSVTKITISVSAITNEEITSAKLVIKNGETEVASIDILTILNATGDKIIDTSTYAGNDYTYSLEFSFAANGTSSKGSNGKAITITKIVYDGYAKA